MTTAIEWAEAPPPEVLDRYKAPDFELVTRKLRMGTFVMRNPSHQEHMLFKKQALDESSQHLASHNVFVSTCVWPDNATLQRVLARWPGIVSNPSIQRAMGYLAGTSDDLEGKG